MGGSVGKAEYGSGERSSVYFVPVHEYYAFHAVGSGSIYDDSSVGLCVTCDVNGESLWLALLWE